LLFHVNQKKEAKSIESWNNFLMKDTFVVFKNNSTRDKNFISKKVFDEQNNLLGLQSISFTLKICPKIQIIKTRNESRVCCWLF